MKTIRTAVEAILVAALLFPTAAHAASKATIAGAFADSCRDFTAHSSKDISHVEMHHADGLVVKDEAVTTPDYAVDGGAGDEIDVAVVKSGTMTQRFTCESGGGPRDQVDASLQRAVHLKARDVLLGVPTGSRMTSVPCSSILATCGSTCSATSRPRTYRAQQSASAEPIARIPTTTSRAGRRLR